jgi:hypothetical protein
VFSVLYALILVTVVNGVTFERTQIADLSHGHCERERVAHYLDTGRKPDMAFLCVPMATRVASR